MDFFVHFLSDLASSFHYNFLLSHGHAAYAQYLPVVVCALRIRQVCCKHTLLLALASSNQTEANHEAMAKDDDFAARSLCVSVAPLFVSFCTSLSFSVFLSVCLLSYGSIRVDQWVKLVLVFFFFLLNKFGWRCRRMCSSPLFSQINSWRFAFLAVVCGRQRTKFSG